MSSEYMVSNVIFSHQWIFITDTVDAIYKPENWTPAALLDRLSDVAGQLPSEGVSLFPFPHRWGTHVCSLGNQQAPRPTWPLTVAAQRPTTHTPAAAQLRASNRQHPRPYPFLLSSQHDFLRECIYQWW